MQTEYGDFRTLWEQRFLAVVLPFLDPQPVLMEGSAEAEFSEDSGLVMVVNMGPQWMPRSGLYQCEVIAQYDYATTDAPDVVSQRWGTILQALGDGENGTEPLRTRLAEGRLIIPDGLDSILYDRAIIADAEARINQFSFTAILGMIHDREPS